MGSAVVQRFPAAPAPPRTGAALMATPTRDTGLPPYRADFTIPFHDRDSGMSVHPIEGNWTPGDRLHHIPPIDLNRA